MNTQNVVGDVRLLSYITCKRTFSRKSGGDGSLPGAIYISKAAFVLAPLTAHLQAQESRLLFLFLHHHFAGIDCTPGSGTGFNY